MKRRLSFAICLLCFVLLLGSCAKADSDGGNDGKYATLTAYFEKSNVESLVQSGFSKEIKSDRYFQSLPVSAFENQAKIQISVSVLNENFNATYQSTSVLGYNEAFFTYKTDAGDQIEIDTSGRITHFESAESFSHVIRRVTGEDNALSPEESLAKATNYLQLLFGENVAARYSAELPDTSNTTVWFFFKPIANSIGVYTNTDRIGIVLSEKGELLAYYAYNVGDFNGKTLPSDFTDDKVKEIIVSSLSTTQGNIELSDNRKLVMLDGNRMACTMGFRVVNGDNVSEWVSVVIPLE
mgnify:CR=1 FL=1